MLGNPRVLVEASPNVASFLVVRHHDVTVVLGPHIQLLLVPCEPVDLQFFRLKQRAHFKYRRSVVLNLRVVNGKTRSVPIGVGRDYRGQRLAAEMVRRVGLCLDA